MPSLGACGSELCFVLSMSGSHCQLEREHGAFETGKTKTPPPQTAVRNGLEGMARARQRGEGRRARGAEWCLDAKADAPGDGAGHASGAPLGWVRGQNGLPGWRGPSGGCQGSARPSRTADVTFVFLKAAFTSFAPMGGA